MEKEGPAALEAFERERSCDFGGRAREYTLFQGRWLGHFVFRKIHCLALSAELELLFLRRLSRSCFRRQHAPQYQENIFSYIVGLFTLSETLLLSEALRMVGVTSVRSSANNSFCILLL